MNCPKCETPNRAGASACKRCQSPLPPTCAGCGDSVAAGDELCGACRTERVPAALGADAAPDGGPDTDRERPRSRDERGFELDPKFVGRRPLLERLRGQVLQAFQRPEPLFLALVGDAGVGKSRLAAELGAATREKRPDARLLVGRAAGAGAPPFAPFQKMLAARFGIEEGEPAAAARAKIERGVASVIPAARAVDVWHLVAQLAGYPVPDSPVVEPLAETPTQLEARMFIALRRFLAADADKAPLLLILDDVERASPESVNLLHYLAAGLDDKPVALVAAGRPTLFEVHPSFGTGDVALERIDVGPLSPEEAALLFAELFRPAGLVPPPILRHARERMGGSPRALFELARHLLEAHALRPEGRAMWRWTDDAAARPLPSSLEELIAARLSHLESAQRDLLEKAAACGEVFWLDALVALVRAVALERSDPDGPSLAEIATAGDRTRVEVADALAGLERRGMIAESPHSSIPGEREYRFAYPPWWEVAYGGIEAESRRRYHRLVAQWLELRPGGRGEDEQEEIARHLERAGDGVAAALRYRRAAEGARSAYESERAIRLFGKALQCLGEGDLASRIQLWHDLGSVYQMRGDNEQALSAFERMLRLAWVVASRTKAAVAFNKMGRIHRQKGDLTMALEYLERGLEFFKQADDERGVAGSLDDIGQVLWLLGRYEEALDRSAAGLERRRKLGDKRSIASSLLNIGHIERHRGLFNEAESCYREALAIRREIADRAGIAASLNGLGVLAFQRGDLAGAKKSWEEALAIAEQIGALPQQAILESHLGELARATGSLGEARTRFERSAQVARDLDDRRLVSEAMRHLGLLELADGDSEKARELCDQALEIAQAAGIRVDVGRALLALGEVHALTLFDDTGAEARTAEDYFQRGVALFREIGNEAELALGLERFGTFRVERGDLAAGRALLTEAQAIFNRLGMRAGDAVKRMITELG